MKYECYEENEFQTEYNKGMGIFHFETVLYQLIIIKKVYFSNTLGLHSLDAF